MTARTMLLSDEEIRNEAEEFTVNPISTDSFRQGFRLGAEFSRTLYEAERSHLFDRCSKGDPLPEPAEWEPDLSKLAERIFREQPAQAAQPQGVKLTKVREALITLSGCIYVQENMDKVIAALAELDAVEKHEEKGSE